MRKSNLKLSNRIYNLKLRSVFDNDELSISKIPENLTHDDVTVDTDEV